MGYEGELAALVTALLWACSAMLFTLSGKRVGANVVNMTRLAIAAVMIAQTHYFVFGTLYPYETEAWRFWVLVASAIVGLVIGDGALFYAFVMIGPRLSMLIMALVPVMSVILAWLIFEELILGAEYLGILLTVIAVGWVVSERKNRHVPEADQESLPADQVRRTFWLGVGLAFVGAIGQTGNLIITKFALADSYSTLSATEIRILVSFVFLAMFDFIRGELVRSFKKLKDRTALIQLCFGALLGPFLGIWMSYIAIEKGRIGIAATIISTSPLLILPLARIFLKERLTWRSIVGTLIAMIGVAVLCFANPQ